LKSQHVTRFWYYFRIGYATYLTFLLGYVSTLITVYYLAIKNLPVLLHIFPDFSGFSAIATLIGAPASVIIGWLHLKRTQAYSAESEITVESSPYTYKLQPGTWKEAFGPLYLELLVLLRKLSEAQGLLTEEEKTHIQEIEKRMQILNSGGFIGTPRRTKIATLS